MSNFISEEDIIYEDNHLIVVNKKSGQIVQADKSGDNPLPELLKTFLKKKYNKPGNVFCGVIHRLDRPVSGACVFAKTSKGLSRMNEIFHERYVKKYYWAIVSNAPLKWEGSLRHCLIKNEKLNKSKAFEKEIKGGKWAELDYELIYQIENNFLISVLPFTGRHHQIRVQLSTIGCPIIGDVKYGYQKANDNAFIYLHARKLTFIHPISDQPIEIIAPLPNEKLWKKFENTMIKK